MQEMNYSTTFDLFMTKDNGTVLVLNPNDTLILRKINYKDYTLPEIVELTGLNEGLVKERLLSLEKEDVIGKAEIDGKVRYFISAIEMMHSTTDEAINDLASISSAKRILEARECVYREEMVVFINMLMKYGVGCHNGLFVTGATLCCNIDNKEWWLNKLDGAKKRAEEGEYTFECTDSDDSLVFDVIRPTGAYDAIFALMPVMGGLMNTTDKLFGFVLDRGLSFSSIDEGRHIQIKLRKTDKKPYAKRSYNPNNFVMKNFKIKKPFAIYCLKRNVPLVVVNKEYIDILDALVEGDASIDVISEMTDLDEETILDCFADLEEFDIIRLNEDSEETYHLSSERVMYCDADNHDEEGEELRKIAMKLLSGKADLYESSIAFMLEMLRSIGIKLDDLYDKTGRYLANLFLKELDLKITPEEYLDLAEDMVVRPDEGELVSKVPIRYNIYTENESVLSYWPAGFIKGFVNEGLKFLTGADYDVVVKTKFQNK